MTSERTGHWTKMRQSLVKFSESQASNHTPSLADFTTTTPELKFSVHTGAYRYPADAATGSHPHKGDPGDPAGDNSGFRGRCPSGGLAARRHRAVRLDHQQMPYRLGDSRPLAAIAAR